MKKYQAIEPSLAFSAKIEPRAESFVPWITRPSWYIVWALAMVPSVAPPEAVGCTAQTIAPCVLIERHDAVARGGGENLAFADAHAAVEPPDRSRWRRWTAATSI